MAHVCAFSRRIFAYAVPIPGGPEAYYAPRDPSRNYTKGRDPTGGPGAQIARSHTHPHARLTRTRGRRTCARDAVRGVRVQRNAASALPAVRLERGVGRARCVGRAVRCARCVCVVCVGAWGSQCGTRTHPHPGCPTPASRVGGVPTARGSRCGCVSFLCILCVPSRGCVFYATRPGMVLASPV